MKLTVTDAAKQWGITRNTVYNKINSGKLSRDANKTIDVTEMIRVFGEPKKTARVEVDNTKQNLASSVTHVNTQELQHKLELEQIRNKHLEELLQKQELANRDYRRQLEAYQRQIEQLNDNLSKANTSIQELATNRLIGMDPEKKTEEVIKPRSAEERVTEPIEEVATKDPIAQKRKKWRWW